jgi:hypothetical protein
MIGSSLATPKFVLQLTLYIFLFVITAQQFLGILEAYQNAVHKCVVTVAADGLYGSQIVVHSQKRTTKSYESQKGKYTT